MKMKKLKKLVAGILSAAMVMSTMAVTAFAAGENDTLIDQSRDGNCSLKVVKYEMQGNIPDDPAGTGEANQKIPTGATKMEGVGFTLWKVADLDNYYTSVGIALPTLEEAKNKVQEESLTPIDGGEKLTDENGEIPYNNLEFGIYYLKETKPSANTISTAVETLISVPMTNVDGDGWLYDITVNPKNQTVYAGVTLKKTDDAGKDLPDSRFVLQIKDGTTWKYVTGNGTDGYNYSGTTYNQDVIYTIPAGGTTFSGLKVGEYRFIEVSAPGGYIMDGSKRYGFVINEDGSITAKDDAYGITTTGDKTAVITVPNEKPEVDKTVGDAEGNYGDDVDYSVGDDVPFKIEVDIPSNIAKLKTFKLTDTMESGLESAKEFSVTYYKDGSVTDIGLSRTPVSTNNGWTLEYSFAEGDMTKLANADTIFIEFKATLNGDAVTGGTGNDNDIELEYSNKILPESDDEGNPNEPGTPTTSKLTDKVVIYTFGMELTKTFNGATPAEGYTATFDLYREDANGSTTIKHENQDVKVSPIGTYTTDEQGKITYNTSQTGNQDKGFAQGTYYFVETATVEGFNLLKDSIKIEITVPYTTTITTTETTTEKDQYGNVIRTATTTTSETTYTEADPTTEAPVYTFTVDNSEGFELPVTGGMGTLLASFAGILLMAGGAFVFLSSRKRKNA